jgi:hypothetical protein
VFPSYHNVEAVPLGGSPPTAQPSDPSVRYTPYKGATVTGDANALVQLKLPPFHLKMVGLVGLIGSPTAQPSESLIMNTELRPFGGVAENLTLRGEVVVLQTALD